MDFANSAKAAESRTRWKGIVANSSVVPRRPSKVMGWNRMSLNFDGAWHTLPAIHLYQ